MKEFGYLEKPSRGVIEREHFILFIGKLDLFIVVWTGHLKIKSTRNIFKFLIRNRIILSGRDLWLSGPTPCSKKGPLQNYCRLLKAFPSLFLNVSGNGDMMTSIGNLFQSLSTFIMKNIILVSCQNFSLDATHIHCL